MPTLHEPIQFGDIDAKNRILMAPLTRGRAGPSRVPNDIMVEYYHQRAEAGLIFTEATAISKQGYGWTNAPAIYNEEQQEGWKRVTDAVHDAGGKMVLQLWHTGRVSHPDFQDGETPVGPSAIRANAYSHTPSGEKKPYVTPRPLETSEIPGVIDQYLQAAKRAIKAGFDGVEIHAANGYLLDQFLRDGTNQRDDNYGGTIDNRARLLIEVTEAITSEIGSGKTGVRLSPTNGFNDMNDSDPVKHFTRVVELLEPCNLAFLHMMEPVPGHFFAGEGERVSPHIRKLFSGPLIANGGYDAESGQALIDNGEADAIAYGVPFLANPDLVTRFKQNTPLNAPDQDSFYGGGAEGYTDYPTLGEKQAA